MSGIARKSVSVLVRILLLLFALPCLDASDSGGQQPCTGGQQPCKRIAAALHRQRRAAAAAMRLHGGGKTAGGGDSSDESSHSWMNHTSKLVHVDEIRPHLHADFERHEEIERRKRGWDPPLRGSRALLAQGYEEKKAALRKQEREEERSKERHQDNSTKPVVKIAPGMYTPPVHPCTPPVLWEPEVEQDSCLETREAMTTEDGQELLEPWTVTEDMVRKYWTDVIEAEREEQEAREEEEYPGHFLDRSLAQAVVRGEMTVVEELIQYGALVNRWLPIDDDRLRPNALGVAAGCGNTEAVRRFIDLGADPNRANFKARQSIACMHARTHACTKPFACMVPRLLTRDSQTCTCLHARLRVV